MKLFNILLPCAIGIEKLLAHEIEKMGIDTFEKIPGRIRLQCNEYQLYKILRESRLSERVLIEVSSFKALNFDQYYQGIRSVKWHEYLNPESKIRIDKVRIHECQLSAVPSLQSMGTKAIADALERAYQGKGLSVSGYEHILRVYGDKDYFRIALDISGEALHKRAYRSKSGRAPLKETIAAALLHANVWRRKTPLYDPFCGSGTICFEALLYAANIAPNLYRDMAVTRLAMYNKAVDTSVVDDLKAAQRFDTLVRIKGSDHEPAMIANSKANLANLMDVYKLDQTAREWVAKSISFEQARVEDCEKWADDGLILCNPPYGERLVPDEGVEILYRSLNDLIERFETWKFSLITTVENPKDFIGHKLIATKKIQNGSSDASVYTFEGVKT